MQFKISKDELIEYIRPFVDSSTTRYTRVMLPDYLILNGELVGEKCVCGKTGEHTGSIEDHPNVLSNLIKTATECNCRFFQNSIQHAGEKNVSIKWGCPVHGFQEKFFDTPKKIEKLDPTINKENALLKLAEKMDEVVEHLNLLEEESLGKYPQKEHENKVRDGGVSNDKAKD